MIICGLTNSDPSIENEKSLNIYLRESYFEVLTFFVIGNFLINVFDVYNIQKLRRRFCLSVTSHVRYTVMHSAVPQMA